MAGGREGILLESHNIKIMHGGIELSKENGQLTVNTNAARQRRNLSLIGSGKH